MSHQEKTIQLEGMVHVSRYDPSAPAGLTVSVSGEPYKPHGQHLIGWKGAKEFGHFCVSSMRLEELTGDAELAEVGERYSLHGRFGFVHVDACQSALVFVTERGERLVVVNDPAGVHVGLSIEVWAYPVQLSSRSQLLPGPYAGSSALTLPPIFGRGVNGIRDEQTEDQIEKQRGVIILLETYERQKKTRA